MEYSNININYNIDNNIVEYNDSIINVKTYLPILLKYNLINTVLDNSYVDGIYNPALIEMNLGVFMIMAYTDITFDNIDNHDSTNDLYDKFKVAGLLTQIMSAIPQQEFKDLIDMLEETKAARTARNGSISGAVQNFIAQLPQMTEELQTALKDFDPEKYKEVINFAQAANGNRPIPLK